MAKIRKKTQEALEEWLLGFERHVGRGVVVSLLVEKGKVGFVSCVDRRRYLSDETDVDSEEGISLHNKKNKVPALKIAGSYIG